MAGARFLTKMPFDEKVKVTVVTALTDSFFDATSNTVPANTYPNEETRAQQWFDSVRTILESAGFEVASRIVKGSPNQVLLDQARELDVDLIALGAQGHWAINRMVVGSTADYIANNAECSVLITRPSDNATVLAAGPKNVLVAYDGSVPAIRAYSDAVKLNWPSETNVVVAMVLDKPKLIPEEEDYDPIAIAEAKENLTKLISTAKCKCNIINSVSERIHIGNSLLSKIAHHKTDLVFMGGTNKSALARFFLGSVGRYLLHNCSCSLWIARSKT